MTRLAFFLSMLVILSFACTIPAAVPAAVSEQPKPSLPIAPRPTLPAIIVTAPNYLHIRSEPNADAEVLGYLMNGESVQIYSCIGLWARINQDNEHPRWVNSMYLSGDTCK